jgi:hypothetical protein
VTDFDRPVESAGLPYGGTDCIAAFVNDLRDAPLWSCIHLAEFPGLIGAREMCRPDVVVCFACAAMDLSDRALSCHCCGVQEPVTTVLLGLSASGVRCAASLCGLCIGLIPRKGNGLSGVSAS